MSKVWTEAEIELPDGTRVPYQGMMDPSESKVIRAVSYDEATGAILLPDGITARAPGRYTLDAQGNLTKV